MSISGVHGVDGLGGPKRGHSGGIRPYLGGVPSHLVSSTPLPVLFPPTLRRGCLPQPILAQVAPPLTNIKTLPPRTQCCAEYRSRYFRPRLPPRISEPPLSGDQPVRSGWKRATRGRRHTALTRVPPPPKPAGHGDGTSRLNGHHQGQCAKLVRRGGSSRSHRRKGVQPHVPALGYNFMYRR